MKKRLVKLCGVGLALILLASLLVIALPASAATLAWSTQAIPNALTFQIAAGTDASFLKVAPNGDIFAVDTAPAAADVVYRSIDGGVTWIPSVAIPANVVDLEISPSYTTDGIVIVAGNTAAPLAQVYISTNRGATFAVLGAAGGAGLVATSVAVSPNYNAGVGEVALGLADPLAGVAALPDVLIWGRGGVQNWVSYGGAIIAGLEDITDVMYSPNFPVDATLICVGSTAARTAVHTMVTGANWDATIGAFVAIATPTGAILDVGGVGTGIFTAEIAIPSDFNSSQPLARTIYVAARSGQVDDRIYRLAVGSAVGPTLIQPTTLVADAEFSSLVFSGMGATGALIAGNAVAAPQVYVSNNPSSPFIAFTAAWAPPTGAPIGAETTYVYPANDYATSSRIYAGTCGANGGVSISDNNGANFYQSGLVDTPAVVPTDIQAVSATEVFLLSNDAAGTADSLWKTVDGGAVWYRVWSVALVGGAGNVGIVRPSPNYGTDQTVYIADIGNVVAPNMWLSTDGGATWAGRACPIAPGDVAVKDQYTIYVGNSAATNVQSTATGGWTWQLAPTPIVAGGAVNDIEIDVATGHLLVASAARIVYISTNNNISYLPVAGGAAVGAAGVGICEFDNGYATNSMVYAAATGAAGVWRATIGVSTNWGAFSIDLIAFAATTLLPQDLLSDPCGALYASDLTGAAAVAPTGGMVRILDPTAPLPAIVEHVSLGDQLVIGDTLTVLTKGGDTIWAIAANVPAVRTFTDILCTPQATGITPAVGSVVDNTQAVVNFTFSAIPGAWNYQIRYDTRADFLSAPAAVASAVIFNPAVNVLPIAPAVNPLVVAGLPVFGQTVYWQVQATAPVFSPWSATYTFNTELVAAAPNSPVILGPFEGGTNYGGWDADVNPTFQWGSILNATGYEFILADNAALNNPLVDLTGANALGVVTAYKLTSITLDYNTTYYWTVRAIGAGTNNTWAPTVAFTTVGVAGSGAATPPTAAPPVVITQVPAPTITIPPAPQATQVTFQPPATEEISPAYIWVIIVIGAVLVIAVIVLIVRTRRSV